jgi:hypothetical protein
MHTCEAFVLFVKLILSGIFTAVLMTLCLDQRRRDTEHAKCPSPHHNANH